MAKAKKGAKRKDSPNIAKARADFKIIHSKKKGKAKSKGRGAKGGGGGGGGGGS